jgi:vacuolar-type H+-ATPase subunit E/Vma4
VQVDKLSRDRMHCERIHDEAMAAAKEAHAEQVRKMDGDAARLKQKLEDALAQVQEARVEASTRVRLL